LGKRYKPSDEFFEIYDGEDPNPVYVGTPTGATVRRDSIEVRGYDALKLLQKTRENAAGFWCHSPRDVIEHYCGLWRAVLADDFTARAYTYSGSSQVSTNGQWSYTRARGDNASESTGRVAAHAAECAAIV